MITISASDVDFETWKALIELRSILPPGWTLVGAQMVALHGLELQRRPPRASVDADLVVNTRIVGTRVSDFASALEGAGYELEGIDPDGIGHRFSDGRVSFDLLAPDGLRRSRTSC